jgi:CRP/FNR family cyclic AMP-dependent transcriptional regulator
MFRQEMIRLSIFKDLSADDIDKMAPLFEMVCLNQNQVIFEYGMVADYLYILLDGEVVVNFKPYDGPQLIVARVYSGDVFGWSSILGRQVYTSEAVAMANSTAIRIGGNELRYLCEKNPQTGRVILETLAGVIAEPLHNTHDQIFTLLTQSMELGNGGARRIKNE